MARTSSSRRRAASKRLNAFPGIAVLAALLVLGAALGGCGNDNPADHGGTMTVDIRGIKQQLGGGFTTSTTGPGESLATTDVKSLIIGAVVITFTDTPLDETTQIDSGIEDKLADDVINSINYFSIVDLPTSDDFVEFKVPPPGAGHWQVAAIGTRNKIEVFEDLNDESVAIYYGFTPQFYNTSGSSGPDVAISMNRACFIDDPPKGCATIGSDGQAAVTPTVRILTVYVNGVNQTTTLTNVTGPGDVATGEAAIESAGPFTSGDEVIVVHTHPDALDFDVGACGSLTNAVALTDPCVGTSAAIIE